MSSYYGCLPFAFGKKVEREEFLSRPDALKGVGFLSIWRQGRKVDELEKLKNGAVRFAHYGHRAASEVRSNLRFKISDL